MNTDPASKPGSHWVALYVDSYRRGEYFDSYGMPPKIPALLAFLKRNCDTWQYNERRVQGLFSSVCGQFCVYFLLNRAGGTPMEEILARFSPEDFEENDFLVTEWVNDNFELNTETYNIGFLVNQVCHALSLE